MSVAVPLQGNESSLAVHRDALILRQVGTYVFRIGHENRAERIPVETGDSSGDLVAITGPLAEGDRVVVHGAETLSDGGIVSILNDTAAAGVHASHASGSGSPATLDRSPLTINSLVDNHWLARLTFRQQLMN